MLKSLVASCLCALSVNSSPLPSRSITNDTTFNVGDNVILAYVFEYGSSLDSISYNLLFHSDNGLPQLKIVSYFVDSPNSFTIDFSDKLNDIDYFTFYTKSNVNANSFFGGDTIYDDDIIQAYPSLVPSLVSISYDINITFEILEGFGGFSIDCFPYLTKIEPPYTPPSKSNLYRLLYDFYYSLFSDDDLAEISTGYNMPFDNWLAHTCTIVTLLVLVFVCFLFLKWLFKVISGLILLKH